MTDTESSRDSAPCTYSDLRLSDTKNLFILLRRKAQAKWPLQLPNVVDQIHHVPRWIQSPRKGAAGKRELAAIVHDEHGQDRRIMKTAAKTHTPAALEAIVQIMNDPKHRIGSRLHKQFWNVAMGQ